MPQLRPLWIWLPAAVFLSVVSIGNVLTDYRLDAVLAALPWLICLCVPLSFGTCWQGSAEPHGTAKRTVEATLLGEMMLIMTILYVSSHSDPASYGWREILLAFPTVYIPLLIVCSAGIVLRHARTINMLPRAIAAAVWTVSLLPVVLHGLFIARLLLSW